MGPVSHEEPGDEEVPFHRRADRIRAQASRARHDHGRDMPKHGRGGGDVSRLAQKYGGPAPSELKRLQLLEGKTASSSNWARSYLTISCLLTACATTSYKPSALEGLGFTSSGCAVLRNDSAFSGYRFWFVTQKMRVMSRVTHLSREVRGSR